MRQTPFSSRSLRIPRLGTCVLCSVAAGFQVAEQGRATDAVSRCDGLGFHASIDEGLGLGDLRGRHFAGTTQPDASGSRRRQPRDGAFDDHVAFEIAEYTEQPEDDLADAR